MVEHVGRKDANNEIGNTVEGSVSEENYGNVELQEESDISFDLDRYPYDETVGLTTNQIKEIAQELARTGIGGEAARSTKIRNRLQEKYPKETIPSARSISDYIKGVQFEGKEQPFNFDDLEGSFTSSLSYIVRLSLIKSVIYKGAITQQEAIQAKRVHLEFADPLGKKVDLIAQYALVRELAERTAKKANRSDIEHLFAFAPWLDDRNSDLYRVALEAKAVTPPMLRAITPLVPELPDGEITLKSLFIGAYAQLNLPFFIGYARNPSDSSKQQFTYRWRDCDTKKRFDVPSVKAKDWKHHCDWRKELDARLKGTPATTVDTALKLRVK